MQYKPAILFTDLKDEKNSELDIFRVHTWTLIFMNEEYASVFDI